MTYQVVTQLTFEFIREIGGEGLNSKAFLARDIQLDSQIVVKSILKSDFELKEDYFNESKMLYSSRHPNIMVINYACEDVDKIYLSMPYHSRGSLNTLMNKRFLSVREIVKYSLDFLSGLHFVHTKKLVHFDIKPTNIIIDDSNRALLTDFGLTKYTDANGFASPDKIYMKHYVPDALVTTTLTNQYDIYQAGLTLYRMCNGNDDFNSQCTSLTQENVMNGTFPLRDKFLPHIPNSTPADNAPIESFHSTLKSETFYLEDLICTTTAIVVQTVRDYITYYNSIRIQAKLNNQSPVDYRRLAA